MKGSFSITSTLTSVLSILAILTIAVSTPGLVQAFGSLSENGTAKYMGIGIATPVSPLHIYSTTATQPETFDLSGTQPLSAMWNDYCNTGGAFSGAGFLARYARGTMASPANVHSGDRLGYNVFGGWVGNWFHTAAIEAVVDTGTVSGSSLPTYMRFLTTPNGSTARVERMRIDSAGRVGINTLPDIDSKLTVDAGTGDAVYGKTNAGTGVRGSAESGYGVYGSSTNGDGVYGSSTSGYAGRFSGNVYVSGKLEVGPSPSVSMGRIYLTTSGLIISTDGGNRALLWDATANEIQITNTSGDWVDYWWQTQKGTTTSGDSGSLANNTNSYAIISGIDTNDYGIEVHFGQADGTAGWCSVWLQHVADKLVGHYIMY